MKRQADDNSEPFYTLTYRTYEYVNKYVRLMLVVR